MTPLALRAGGALTETDQRLTFFVALHAPRLGSIRNEAPTKPDSSFVLPVKGARENESERLHRTGPRHVFTFRVSLRVESFGFSAKQKTPIRLLIHPVTRQLTRDFFWG